MDKISLTVCFIALVFVVIEFRRSSRKKETRERDYFIYFNDGRETVTATCLNVEARDGFVRVIGDDGQVIGIYSTDIVDGVDSKCV